MSTLQLITLFDNLRDSIKDKGLDEFPYSDFRGSTILVLIFLKFISSSGLGADNAEVFQTYLKVSRALNSEYNDIDENDLMTIINSAGKKFGIDRCLDGKILKFQLSLATDLFVENKADRRLSWTENKQPFLEFKKLDFSKYKPNEIVSAIGQSSILKTSCVLSEIGNLNPPFDITDVKLATIVSRILKVTDDDTFVDCLVGSGLTASIICGESKPLIIINDENIQLVSVACMMLILSGQEDILAFCDDFVFTGAVLRNKADKIYTEPDFNLGNTKLGYSEGYAFNDPENPFKPNELPSKYNLEGISVSVLRAWYALKKEGKAIIRVPARFLFGSQNNLQIVRSYLLESKALQAIISLPSCSEKTNAPSALLVLSKTKNVDITMVDLIGGSHWKEYYTQEKGKTCFKDSSLEAIPMIINEKKAVDGVSSIITYKDVKADNLSPSIYIDTSIDTYRSVREIDIELNEIYEEISLYLKYLSIVD